MGWNIKNTSPIDFGEQTLSDDEIIVDGEVYEKNTNSH